MKQERNTLYADYGKILKYKNKNVYFGDTVYLGYKHLEDGSVIYDTIYDFEEVDDISRENIEEINFDD